MDCSWVRSVEWSPAATPWWYACRVWLGLTRPMGAVLPPGGLGPVDDPMGEPPPFGDPGASPGTTSGGFAWEFQTGWVSGPAGIAVEWTVQLRWWCLDHLGSITLGNEHWINLKCSAYVAGIVCVTLCLLYGLDIILRPFVCVGSHVYRLWRWLRGGPKETPILTLHDCEWRGPGTNRPVGNE